MNDEERIAKELHHLIENRIQHAYESGFSDGTKKTQEQYANGITFHAKLSSNEWTGFIDIIADLGMIEKDMKWIRKEIAPDADKEKGWEFSGRYHKVMILPPDSEPEEYKETV
jgi:hypothetical protein